MCTWPSQGASGAPTARDRAGRAGGCALCVARLREVGLVDFGEGLADGAERVHRDLARGARRDADSERRLERASRSETQVDGRAPADTEPLQLVATGVPQSGQREGFKTTVRLENEAFLPS